MKKPLNEHVIPTPLLDLVKQIYEVKNINTKQILIDRLRDINDFCTDILVDLNKKK